MRCTVRRARTSGYTLLEIMVATVVMAIIFMGLLSSISGSFLATNQANRASESQATARRILEEASELECGDMLLLDGNSLVTADGIAAKYEVFETSPGLLTLEVEVCRPLEAINSAELAAMTMNEFRQLPAVGGSRVRYTTLSTGTMARASVTDVTVAGDTGGAGDTGAGTDPDAWWLGLLK